ncbi:uncharacterized protein CDV56_104050 [Aspergillus thermomutatus]|uniref:DUF7587 domain-containing protein n=1 Tax=Aspergillus thermomutatus TaxID=41047 RepID=A0A397GPV3_ASPTH|nr:uncharacterized protein CDV56_104050 [Aspergillus thermomutatus]RHZ53111.1 hypothetical protein CDV56_104050 [Aspergillus thermomutatus]
MDPQFHPLSGDDKPYFLFRAESQNNRSFGDGGIFARHSSHHNHPTRQDFDNHLAWQRTDTGLVSFFSSWRRVMQRRQMLINDNEGDVIVVAVQAKNLVGVNSAERVAEALGYRDENNDPRRRPCHRDEYLVFGGVAPDDYAVLAVFEGREPCVSVTFNIPSFEYSGQIPGNSLPGQAERGPLVALEDEMYRRTGRKDDLVRDELVRTICEVAHMPWLVRTRYRNFDGKEIEM